MALFKILRKENIFQIYNKNCRKVSLWYSTTTTFCC